MRAEFGQTDDGAHGVTLPTYANVFGKGSVLYFEHSLPRKGRFIM